MRPLVGTGAAARATASRAAEDGALVARLTGLAPALDGEPDPEWRARTRARLVAMAAVRADGPERISPVRRLLGRGGRRSRLVVGLAGALAAVTAVAAVVALSSDVGRGDARDGTEQAQLALAGDARGRTLLGSAGQRLEELAAVVRADGPAVQAGAALAAMDAETVDGASWLARRAVETGSAGPLDDLAGWSAGQAAALDDLRPDLPTAARDAAARSADLLARVEARIEGLRLALDCAGGPAIDGSDALGPVPGTCA